MEIEMAQSATVSEDVQIDEGISIGEGVIR
jgi:hypothetical protein